MALSIEGKEVWYQWIQETLIRFKYRSRGKKERGLILRNLERVSGYSRAQVKRLLQQYGKRGKIERQQRTVAGFGRFYTPRDAALLAETDELHGTLSGAATKKLWRWPMVAVFVALCS